MKQDLKLISKFLSYVLRHKPEEINLQLDNNGWADINELILKMKVEFNGISLDDIKTVVNSNDKQRFALNEDETKIRANQGHSINIDLELKPSSPPEFLFHGTVAKSISSIKSEGLIKGNRQHVHLSLDIETAINVGNRRGDAIILKINSNQMFLDGYKFYLSQNQVWLSDFIPSKYIQF